MKPSFEQIPTTATASWSMLDRRLPEAIPFEWHHHPEYELTLTLNSRGQRYISGDVRAYDDCDLVLLGPNVPHSWSSQQRIDPRQPHVALVIWFSEAWATSLVELFPEMAGLRPMLAAARGAVQFSGEAARESRPLIEAMVAQDEPTRLVSLLALLTRLSRDPGAEKILPAAAGPAVIEDGRLQRVLEHIHAHYCQALTIAELARLACVSVSAFHRMFRRHARATPLEYIARLRIGRACELLVQGPQTPVTQVAEAVGYGSLALFNRQFKARQGMTPSAFRQHHRAHFR
ncbi:AraC family transcriptional regulator [Pseudomonas chlororaphis subsp. aurantiaca]|uniref:helix-turn-helix domain-containing protein n=1 Tax=Pseudomonas chlororaphis TaxID=587753 RepID=UPI0027DC2721|nr:AraC family transcriptional regulator [Pseudomonas chlororaphis]WMJ02180.1 AraC family transcriptional regulator [Pseudomonas chlororaphis subsp. aurantiaca]